jgi:hypothetical protein
MQAVKIGPGITGHDFTGDLSNFKEDSIHQQTPSPGCIKKSAGFTVL